MRADLDTLLEEAGTDPTSPLDPDTLWGTGRRRRLVRRVTAAASGLAGIAAIALVATTVIGTTAGPGVPEIEPMAPTPPAVDVAPDRSEQDTAVADEASPQVADDRAARFAQQREAAELAQQRLIDDVEAAFDRMEQAVVEQLVALEAEAEAGPTPAPSPDPAAVADPCAPREGGEMAVFIDVVSPVAEQQLGGQIELVGCASVYEATVRYRVLDASGQVLVDSFTTATAGGPDIGEFRESIAVGTTGAVTLEVFWDSPKDGEGERDKITVELVNG